MKDFESHEFDLEQCQRDLLEFRTLLGSSNLGEDQDILPFFRDHWNLSALIGHYNGHICRVDRIAFECDLFGDFACDLVVGDSNKQAYNFIEFEDAASNSLFVKKGRKTTSEWSRRFEGGYSQIIDWFYKLDDL